MDVAVENTVAPEEGAIVDNAENADGAGLVPGFGEAPAAPISPEAWEALTGPSIAGDLDAGGVAGPEPEGPPPYAAWLVENGGSSIHNPLYIAVTVDGVWGWSPDANAALQFVREQDAANVAKLLAPGIAVRIEEHGFAP